MHADAGELGRVYQPALATAFGAFAERVERSEGFPAAFARAQASGVAALIELRVDPFQITPGARLPA
ncbi:hypothetical protein [Paraburkholderia saeva]|uniref:hypothetical protein n=1 Tax=Paraburkholderia saeva TaxID=2777537 RepID=UPI001E2DC0AB|nr:hypothetical protein [Paraburkholderia saeva]